MFKQQTLQRLEDLYYEYHVHELRGHITSFIHKHYYFRVEEILRYYTISKEEQEQAFDNGKERANKFVNK
jgi:hypothetical protein